MKVQIVSEVFYPDRFRINEIVSSLTEDGHEVSVLTALPDYSTGLVPETYRHFRRRKEKLFGAEVRRIHTFARRTGVLHRALNYASFFVGGTVQAILRKRPQCDVVFVYGTSPVFQLFPALILGKRAGCPVIFYCCDLWPESLKAWNVKENSLLYRAVALFSKWMYQRCDLIAVSSRPFREYLTQKCGVPDGRLVYLPQHFEDMDGAPFGYTDNQCIDFMFTGNLGAVQNLDCVLQAAERIKDLPGFHIHFVGDGSELAALKKLVGQLNLNNRVTFHGHHPPEEMEVYYRLADCFLLTLRGGDMVGSTLPGKAQGYLCAGKPVIGAIDGAGAELIREADCGLVVPAGSAAQLAEAIKAVTEDFEKYRAMGQNGRRFYEANFTKKQFMSSLYSIFDRVAAGVGAQRMTSGSLKVSHERCLKGR